MNKTNIPWADFTWNPITGCTKGCNYCYAKKIAMRFCDTGVHNELWGRGDSARVASPGEHFPWIFDPTVYPHRLEEPTKLKKPSRIFLGSMGDLFDPAFPDEFRDRVFATVAATPQHTYLLLTKQPENMRRYWTRPDRHNELELTADRHDIGEPHPSFGTKHILPSLPLPNLWIGVTVTNQADADERIPLLLDTPAAHRFVSIEPMLGPITFRWASWDDLTPNARRGNSPGQACEGRTQKDGRPLAAAVDHLDGLRMLDWVVAGAKTPGKPLHERLACSHSPCVLMADNEEAAVCNTDAWCPETDALAKAVRDLRDQCAEAGVPFFYKHAGTTPALDGVVHDALPGADAS